MCDNVAGSGGPVRSQTVVASDPLGADIGVDLHAMGLAVVGRRGDGIVRERERLVHKV